MPDKLTHKEAMEEIRHYLMEVPCQGQAATIRDCILDILSRVVEEEEPQPRPLNIAYELVSTLAREARIHEMHGAQQVLTLWEQACAKPTAESVEEVARLKRCLQHLRETMPYEIPNCCAEAFHQSHAILERFGRKG